MLALWTLYVALGITVLLLWQRVGINLSLTSLLLSMMLLFHGPAYVYYTRWWGPETDFYDTILSATRGQGVLPTLDLALALTFLFVCIGIVVVDMLAHVSVRKWRSALSRWGEKTVSTSPSEAGRVILLSATLTISILLPFVIIDDQLPKVLNYFTSNLGEFEKIALRREGGGSDFYIYNLLLATLLPFISFCLLVLVIIRAPHVRGWAFLFIVLVALAKAATLSKAPLAVFALQCAVVWLMMRNLSLSWRTVIILALLATLLFVLMAFVANPSAEELLFVLQFLFYRVFMIVNEGLLEYFTAIPYVIDHSWGTQISWVGALFQSKPMLPTYWLVGEVHRGTLGSTTTVMFMGDAWADFAWVGVALTAFLAGAVVRWIDIQLIVKRGKTMASIAGLGLGHFGLFIALSTALQTALVTGGLAFVVPLVSVISAARRRHVRVPRFAPWKRSLPDSGSSAT
jgi:oligosaccharide repeat unit polymerase